ncbi:response regulator transcription factor [Candidatus Saccharibacteria bacterium]|nr:response regulator transcription factor [Candidatus Saccharibacteria bacterium]
MRILVVEDEYKIANALKRGLSSEGYATDVAYNGDDGLANALNDPYDLVILDRMLPGGYDGIAIVSEMRKSKIMTPVLMLTAKDSIPDRVAGLDAGADDYMIKPFAFEELLARIRALTRSDENKTPDAKLEYKGLSLDLKTKLAFREGKSIELSLKEFSLLDYLLRNPEVVLTKQQIIDHVWDYDADILPNTVEAFIAMLRNKVDRPFEKGSYIQTIRGFGYKLEKRA